MLRLNNMKLPKFRRPMHWTAILFLGGAMLSNLTAAASDTSTRAASTNPCPKTGAKVLVNASGSVTLNGTVVSVEKLAAALSALAPRPTEVCYFREKAKGEPPAAVRAATNAIISARLPISFYSDASFSSRVGMPSH
jgi:hypothetical protein